MQEIARFLYGSHLYGTALSDSDRDIKTIFIPSGKDILLQHKTSSVWERTEFDIEHLSLLHFFNMLKQGQTLAFELLFADPDFLFKPVSAEWLAIAQNKERFLHSGIAPFVGYCFNQAGKFIIKADRYNALEETVTFINKSIQRFDLTTKLADLREWLEDLATKHKHIRLENIPGPNGKEVWHLSVCSIKTPLTANLKEAKRVYSGRLAAYGHRTRKAADLSGKDWKSIYHALRVLGEAREFLSQGKITFPRPDAAYLVKVRKGEVALEEINRKLEKELEWVETAVKISKLPAKPDIKYIDTLIYSLHRNEVLTCQ